MGCNASSHYNTDVNVGQSGEKKEHGAGTNVQSRPGPETEATTSQFHLKDSIEFAVPELDIKTEKELAPQSYFTPSTKSSKSSVTSTTSSISIPPIGINSDSTSKASYKINVEEESKLKLRAHKVVFSKAFTPKELTIQLDKIPKSKAEFKAIKKALKRCYLFSDYNSDQLNELISYMKKETIVPGSTIISQDEVGTKFYVIQSGTYDFYQNGKFVSCLDATSETSYFGETCLLFNSTFSSVVKLNDTNTNENEFGVLWSIDRNTFKQVVTKGAMKLRVEILDALQSIPMLNDTLNREQLAQVAEAVQVIKVKANQQIVKKGDFGDICYFIKSGKVICSEIGDDNQGQIVLHEGNYFGERALLTEEPRAANVTALTKTSLMVIDGKSFNKLLGPLRSIMDDNMKLRVIESVPILSQLSTPKRNEVLNEFKIVSFKDKQTIIKAGTIGDCFYIVRSGMVTVNTKIPLDDNANTIKKKIATLKEGDFFGEMALVNKQPRNATCKATGKGVTCFALDKQTFKRVLKKSPYLLKTCRKRNDSNLALYRSYSSSLSSLNMDHVSSGSSATANSSFLPTLDDENNQNNLNKSLSQSRISFEMEASTAKSLSDLTKHAIVGKGAFGTVYLVSNNKSGQKKHQRPVYALKCMNKTRLIECDQKTQVLSEKKILSSCDHPFIIKLLKTFKDQDTLYMLLEFVHGGELFTIMQQKYVLPITHTRFYSACIIDIFAYLHSKKIIYRDLKPENVLIDVMGYCKICDFGFAKQQQKADEKTFTLCGTPEYLAPEIILGNGHDKGVDYYGVGILLYEMLVGRSPFAHSDPQTVLRSIVDKEVNYNRLKRALNGSRHSLTENQNYAMNAARGRVSLQEVEALNNAVEDLISKLVNKASHNRLGNLKDGVQGIMNHPFYSSEFTDWKKLRHREYAAPYIPDIKNNLDTSKFEQYTPDVLPSYSGSNKWCSEF